MGGGRSHSELHATFYANCAGDGDIQKQDRAVYMYGAFEVFSVLAIEKYFEKVGDCEKSITFEAGGWWEERFMTHCLESAGVKINPWMNADLSLLSDPHCSTHLEKPDCDGGSVAFHPLDTLEQFKACYNTAHHDEDV